MFVNSQNRVVHEVWNVEVLSDEMYINQHTRGWMVSPLRISKGLSVESIEWPRWAPWGSNAYAVFALPTVAVEVMEHRRIGKGKVFGYSLCNRGVTMQDVEMSYRIPSRSTPTRDVSPVRYLMWLAHPFWTILACWLVLCFGKHSGYQDQLSQDRKEVRWIREGMYELLTTSLRVKSLKRTMQPKKTRTPKCQ